MIVFKTHIFCKFKVNIGLELCLEACKQNICPNSNVPMKQLNEIKYLKYRVLCSHLKTIYSKRSTVLQCLFVRYRDIQCFRRACKSGREGDHIFICACLTQSVFFFFFSFSLPVFHSPEVSLWSRSHVQRETSEVQASVSLRIFRFSLPKIIGNSHSILAHHKKIHGGIT